MSIEKINFYGGLKVLSYLTNKYLKEQRGFQNEGEWLFVQKMKELLHRLRRHFINLYSISCHSLLWTFIIIDSQLFSPSFRTYAFVYSCTDCCRSQFFFERVFLPAAASALLFLMFLMFLYYSCISLFNIFSDSHFRMFRFDHR